ncbi:MAG: YigZ family protein [Crocinitomicaceae bacterium]|nr:YigZ family protein [Crocinitomicaceae bacterium]
MEELKHTYQTVRSLSEGIYKEKGSKFIGYVAPCYTEDEAKQLLEQWRKNHFQARHVCYAYRFGLDGKIVRSNDDGEPNNSAGIPILGQIQSFALTNVLVGVVRYFGGTKLGVGGLVQAYKTAAKEAIEEAEIIVVEVFEWVEITFEYSELPQVMHLLKTHNVEQRQQNFELTCTLVALLPLNNAVYIKNELEKLKTVSYIIKGIY